MCIRDSNDPDGLERVQIDLGVFAPVGQTSWMTMHDDGLSGGDERAGDGVYSVFLSIREGTPLGTHEVFLRSVDTYGEVNTTSTAITLVEPETPTTESGLSATLLGVLGLVVLVAAGVVIGLMWRRQDDGKGGVDRFGSQ